MRSPSRLSSQSAGLLALSLALASCTADADAPSGDARMADPAELAALAAPITTDPDLASENLASAAFHLPESLARYPRSTFSKASSRIALEEANRIAGPQGISEAPAAADRADDPALRALLAPTAAARVAFFGRDASICAATGTYSAAWAAQMPGAFPVFPLGQVKESLGADSAGCDLRSVRFTAPVEPKLARDFYHTLALRNGFSPRVARIGNAEVIKGSRRNTAFGVVVAPAAEAEAAQIDILVYGT